MLQKGQTKKLPTLIVTGCTSATTVDGRTAIVLDTKQFGQVGFMVTQKMIDDLRRELAIAESFLHQKVGSAQ